MALPRPSCLRGAVGRSTLRKAGSNARSNPFRQAGRRTYASGHEAKKSSDLPWIVGSAAVTIPAATWLLGQAPTPSPHGHDETEPEVVKSKDGEDSEEQPKEDQGGDDGKEDDKEEAKEDEGKEESKDEGDESKDEGKSDDSDSDSDKGKDTPQTSDDEQYEPPSPGSPGQINKSSNPTKGPGEGQKGDRKPTEKKGEKDAAKNYSGAQHPYLEDPEKSKKTEGITDTAKIHGTVDPRDRSSKKD